MDAGQPKAPQGGGDLQGSIGGSQGQQFEGDPIIAGAAVLQQKVRAVPSAAAARSLQAAPTTQAIQGQKVQKVAPVIKSLPAVQ